MYGSYHEPKFDALGLTLRLESLANTHFQELIDGTDLNLITRATLVRLHEHLKLFNRVLALDGIVSQEMTSQLDLLAHSLTIRGFSFTQYLDIFRGFSKVVGNMVRRPLQQCPPQPTGQYHQPVRKWLDPAQIPGTKSHQTGQGADPPHQRDISGRTGSPHPWGCSSWTSWSPGS